MERKLLLLLSLLSFGLFVPKANAQLTAPLFTLPYDTVCVGSEFVPDVLVNNAQSYNWSFCPPLLENAPLTTNLGVGNYELNDNSCITSVKVDTFFYNFTAGQDGKVFRYQYIGGLETIPVVTDFGHYQRQVPENPTGIQVINDKTGWHVFVIGSNLTGTLAKLVRLDFASGLNYAPTSFHSYDISNLTNPRELFTVVVNDSMRAFTFDKGKELERIDFSANIDGITAFTNFGNLSGAFDGVSGIAAITEQDNYHFIVTNEISSKISHVTFGNSFLNTPFAVDLGDFNTTVKVPTGITITKNCNDYYGYVINRNSEEWVTIHWSASIADIPDANSIVLSTVNQPLSLSNALRKEDGVFAFITNSDQTLTRVKFSNCTNASVPGSDLRIPPAVKYNTPGVYSVFLTVDEGLATERNYCQPIFVEEHPAINLTTQDTAICSGDTVNMHALTFGTDSITWSPNYNIDTLSGRFVKVWPEYTTDYFVTINFAPNCIVKEAFKIHVDNVKSDAGEDRWITDGSTTVIGGPLTTVRPGYTYTWTPNVYFESTVDSPVSIVRPAQNMTYYLTVTAPSGCSAIDSVFIGVPCENIIMPNAFTPATTSFGLMNLQLTQVNYFKIFDRWGREVFSTANPNVKWNGRDHNGVECQFGVYVWEVDAFCKDTNQRFRQSGNVTLIR